MGPDADELEAIGLLWRDLVNTATAQTRALACMSAGGQEQQCYDQVAYGSKPPAYEPFESLSASLKQEIRGSLEGLFNVSVPELPVRLPVLHWDSRVRDAGRGQMIDAYSRKAPEAAKQWVQGRGEPRQDAWQLMDASIPGHPERDAVVRALQKTLVHRYLLFQVQQLLNYIEEWGYLMDPEQIRCAVRACVGVSVNLFIVHVFACECGAYIHVGFQQQLCCWCLWRK